MPSVHIPPVNKAVCRIARPVLGYHPNARTSIISGRKLVPHSDRHRLQEDPPFQGACQPDHCQHNTVRELPGVYFRRLPLCSARSIMHFGRNWRRFGSCRRAPCAPRSYRSGMQGRSWRKRKQDREKLGPAFSSAIGVCPLRACCRYRAGRRGIGRNRRCLATRGQAQQPYLPPLAERGITVGDSRFDPGIIGKRSYGKTGGTGAIHVEPYFGGLHRSATVEPVHDKSHIAARYRRSVCTQSCAQSEILRWMTLNDIGICDRRECKARCGLRIRPLRKCVRGPSCTNQEGDQNQQA